MELFFFFYKMSYLAELIMVVVPSWTSLISLSFHNLFIGLLFLPHTMFMIVQKSCKKGHRQTANAL